MPNNKETERLLKIAKNGPLAVHDEVVTLEEVVESNHTEVKEEIKEIKGLVKEVVGVERLKGEQGESIKGDKGDKGADSKVIGLKGSKGEQGEEGEKGDTGDKGKDGKTGKDGKNGESGKDVEKNVVEELRNELKKLDTRIKNIPKGGRVMTPRYVHVPMVDVFTGDASTKAFTLSKAPKSLETMKGWGSDFPFILAEGSDNGFTVVGKTLTLNDVVDAPSLNARFVVEYYI